ncbi:MAG: aminotransferase class V-fold PLP-dependent enzyme [Bacteroidia bacterium]|nr:aminotransferase class V-fold PLP-dependent enzyme [Bacteroidia bacterium]
MNKREFLKKAGLLGLAGLSQIPLSGKTGRGKLPGDPDSPDFWQEIRNGYDLPDDFVNLENGYYCVQPRYIREKYEQHIREVNRLGARYMRTVQFENKKAVAAKLAAAAGVPADELIITRNTTEALDMVIAGFPWRKGDEAVMAVHDYGAMLDMFKQVARRHGIVNRMVTVPLHPKTDEEIVDVYARAITKRTKLLMVSHMINITGQILPVRKIADMARSRGVQVMVDGAHAFAHFRFSVADLNCDYYACSLHKWLSTPLGAGFLWMRKEHIPKIWPLFGEEGIAPDNIARLNHTGTHPPHTDLAIADALDYYKQMGAERKENRLRALHGRLRSQVEMINHAKINTPADLSRHCAIINIGIPGMAPSLMAQRLFDEFKIYTVAIDNNGVQGCRITPNVFNTFEEMDRLAAAIGKIHP